MTPAKVLSALLLLGSAAQAAPAWCPASSTKLSYNYMNIDELPTQKEAVWAIYHLVGATCNRDGNSTSQAAAQKNAAQVDEIRARWSKSLGMEEQDWADAAEWALQGQSERHSPTMRPKNTKSPLAQFSAVDQYALMVSGGLLGDSRVDLHYIADALGERLTEAGRVGYLTECVRSTNPVELAMCEHDAKSLDAAKLNKDLRADTTHNGAQRMAVRIAGYDLRERLSDKHAAAVKALIDKDPGYKQMFELAEETWKNFSVDSKLFALAGTMDEARYSDSRRASAGCADSTWAAWHDAVSKIPAKKFTRIKEDPRSDIEKIVSVVLNDPNGYLAAVALAECQIAERKVDYLGQHLALGIARWPGFRGPRSAAATAILAAGVQLDDRDAKIELPRFQRSWVGGGGGASGGHGSIASVAPKGETAVVTLAKRKFTERQCMKGHPTKRVLQVTNDGRFIYDYVCDEWKMVSGTTDVAPPQTVAARQAKALRPGMMVHILNGVVIAAYGSDGAAAPKVVAGVEVR
jgi:hypothetical protein